MKNPTALVQWRLIPNVTSGSCIKGGSAQCSSLAHRRIQTLLPAAPEVRYVLLLLFVLLLLLLLVEEKLALGAVVSSWVWARSLVSSPSTRVLLQEQQAWGWGWPGQGKGQ